MRLYSFVNALYLKEIQYGIQTAHLVSDMFTSQPTIPRALDPSTISFNRQGVTEPQRILTEWASKHKTIIVLNGGNSGMIETFYQDKLFPLQLKFPVGIFYEDQESLGGAATACGIVLPEEMYDAVPNDGLIEIIPGASPVPYAHYDQVKLQFTTFQPATPEWNLLSVLRGFRLA